MKVEVTRSRCQAYGNCADEAPQVFRIDESGYVELVGDETVPPDLEPSARAAVISCPARALSAAG